MIVGYVRTSTEQQNSDLQMRALQEARCERIFEDVASGSRDDRKEFRKCISFLQSGDVLVVYKLDRLGRSLKSLVNTVLDLNDRGVSLVITTMAIDTRTPTGKLIFGILASIAEFERELIKERVRAGIEAAKARGVRFGRPTLVTPEIVAQARIMIEADASVRNAAVVLGVSKSALYDALSETASP